MEYVEDMRKNSGTREALDLQKMLAENTALFAGGTLSEEAKDAYFQAVAEAYYDCKKAARKTFGKKKKSTIIFSRNIVRKEGAVLTIQSISEEVRRIPEKIW